MSQIHFLNVGHSDYTFIEHDSGRITVIACNNADDLDADSEAEILAELPPASAASIALWRVTGISKHPDHDASHSYRAASQHVWSTRWKSDITIDIEATGRMTASNRPMMKR